MPAAKRKRVLEPRAATYSGSGPAGYGYYLAKKYPSSKYYQRAFPRNIVSQALYGPSLARANPGQLENRMFDNMTGRGKYSFGRSIRKFGSSVKSAAKALGVEGLRKGLADKARGIAAERIAGMGTYATQGLVSGRGMYVDNNSDELIKGQYHGPHYSSFSGTAMDDGAVTVSNQEFYQYVYAPETTGSIIPYTSFSVPINPGTLTPLLSQMASNFERYEMVQCMFHFESSLDGGALQSETGQVGDIMMVSHMDVNRVDYSNASEFEHNSSHVVSARITQGLTCGVECDPSQMTGLTNAGINFVRTSEVDDKERYDQARVQFALNNVNPALAGRCIGRMYVSYTVKLIKQRLYASIGRGQLSDEFTFQNTGTSFLTKAATDSLKFFVKKDASTNLPYIQNIKEPWSNLGCTIVPLNVAKDTLTGGAIVPDTSLLAREKIGIKFTSNQSGLFRITLSASHASNDPLSISGPDGNLIPMSNVFVDEYDTTGNVVVVPTRAFNAPSDSALSVESNQSLIDTDDYVPCGLKDNIYVVTDNSNISADPLVAKVANVMYAHVEMYVRVAPATNASSNMLSLQFTCLSGSGNSTSTQNTNVNQFEHSSIRIEQVNDHERVGDKTISSVYE